MDGTLCDYTGQIQKDLEKMRSPFEKEPYNIGGDVNGEVPDWLDNRISAIKNVRGWWRNLPRLEDGFQIFDLAVKIGFTPSILTKGPFRTSLAWEEKYNWCREQIDAKGHTKRAVSITITEDKSRVYGRVLVEDWPPYIQGWLKWRKRGLVVILNRPYNKDFNHPQVVRYDGTEASFAIVRERMQAAYDRTE